MNPMPAPRRRIARHRATDYWQVSTHLMESARTLLTLGDKEYGNAIGICIIHAVISANDAITIHHGEVRSSSEQHADAQRLLLEVARKVPDKAGHKNNCVEAAIALPGFQMTSGNNRYFTRVRYCE